VLIATAARTEDPLDALCTPRDRPTSNLHSNITGTAAYATMQRHRPADSMNDVDRMLAESAYKHFTAAVIACMDAGALARADPLTVALEFWSTAHGMAALVIAKPRPPWGDKMALADRVLRSAALGHEISGTKATRTASGQHPTSTPPRGLDGATHLPEKAGRRHGRSGGWRRSG
jgi:hypothetical protein